jgi:hypothetical protein
MPADAQQIIINEVMTNNASTIKDEDGDNPDWIELYNNSNNPINLSGYGLSDDPAEPFKWAFGEYLIKPGEYLLVWASDKNLQAGILQPSDIAGLMAHFSAGNINVTDTNQVVASGNILSVKKWQSHNDAFQAIQSKPENRPAYITNAIGNLPALRFDGTSQCLVSNLLPPDGNQDRTILVMTANANMQTGNQNTYNNLYHYGDYSNTYGLMCRKRSAGGGVGGNYWSSFFTSMSLMDSQPRFFTQIYNGTADVFYENGRFAGNNYIELNTGTKFPLHIATRIGNPKDLFAGDIAEIIVFGKALTKDQKRRVENYLAEKYQLPQQLFHTNFKLSSEGETLVLTRPDGTTAHQVIIPALLVNRSYGRGNEGNFGFFAESTPGAANSTPLYTATMSPPVFSHESGFYTDTLQLVLQCSDPGAQVLYTLDGSDPDINAIQGKAIQVKYDYSECNAGEIVQRDNYTHLYTQSFAIGPKYNLPGDRSLITATYLNWTPVYTPITQATIVRAACWKDGTIISPAVSKTFLVDSASVSRYHLPVVSVILPDYDLFDYDTGIYVMGRYYDETCLQSVPDANYKHDDWERGAQFELFDSAGELLFRQTAGIRIHGNFSANQARKSFRFEARKKYDNDGVFKYALFPGLRQVAEVGSKPVEKFNAFLIRNSGNNHRINLFHDAMVHRLVNHTVSDGQASRAVVHFVNGEYWGIMNLREKHDENYFSEHYNMAPEEVIIANARTQSIASGYPYEYDHYYNLEKFAGANSLALPENYNYLNTQMDISNYLNHFMLEIYINNTDFLGNNRKFWRKRTPRYMPYAPLGHDGRWRWILYDLDQSFAKPDYDRLTVTTTGNFTSNLILRKLLENNDASNYFINLFCDHMNTTFLPQRVMAVVDSMKNNMDHDLPEHIGRWGSVTANQNYEEIADFAHRRPIFMKQHLRTRFGLADTCNITVKTDISKGKVKINSLTINSRTIGIANPQSPYPWTGEYFTAVPVILVALPNDGYIFSHWSNNSTNDTLVLTLSGNTTIEAFFKPGLPAENVLIINEINYNSSASFDPGDWVEFYNPQDYNLNISQWYFKDENDDHVFTFPENTIIPGNGYLVLCEKTPKFTTLFPDVSNFIGNMEFGLSGSGELLRLYNKAGNLIDTVHYKDSSPWPSEPDGNGPTLELIRPDLDNALPQNWMASSGHGTPGKMNSHLFGDYENTGSQKSLFVYPNPFSSVTHIVTPKMANQGAITLLVIDRLGAIVFSAQYNGGQTITFDRKGLPAGLYFVQITNGIDYSASARILIVN